MEIDGPKPPIKERIQRARHRYWDHRDLRNMDELPERAWDLITESPLHLGVRGFRKSLRRIIKRSFEPFF